MTTIHQEPCGQRDPEHTLIKKHVPAAATDEEGEFVACHIRIGSHDVAIIAGNSPQALRDGVYSLLEQKLGHGGITEENRVPKVKAMLRDAIDCAVNTVGLDFNWAIDIHTTYSNPKNLIAKTRCGATPSTKIWKQPAAGWRSIFSGKYAEMISHDIGPTRGEMGILIQHNLKWLNPKTADRKAPVAN